jgi:phenylalanyl-tRNA synthetase beta chain
VAAGQKVPVAPVGTVMPDGLVIKKAKLRGESSHGMICSERELGLGDGHEGIMVLGNALTPGTPLAQALNLDCVVLNIDITPNRADCLSVLGLAREVSAAFDLPLTMPTVNLVEGGEPFTNFTIEAHPQLCPLYQTRLIRDVTIGPSPAWLRYRLLAVGLRPINNIVDVTNYILMECGQPLHAFDRDLLRGRRIRVDTAQAGETFVTLDDQTRLLTEDDLLIWDDERPVALAGVMGGADSGITAASTSVLLESAVFSPVSVRKTARRLGISSEASYRFERGVDQEGNTYAMNRAASLMAELSGGLVAPGVPRSEPLPFTPKIISFAPARAGSLLGLEMTPQFCRETLACLGCTIQDQGEVWNVTAPSFRPDLEREVDLIEEVARVYGMDRIPSTLPTVRKRLDDLDKVDPTFAFLQEVKDWGRAAGLAEVINYSFVSTADLDRCGLPVENRVYISNPLSEEMNVLRTELAPGLLNSLRHNVSRDNVRVRIFETAHTFVPDPGGDTQVRENNRLAVLLHGERFPGRYPYPQELSGYADMKGLVEHCFSFLGIARPDFHPGDTHAYLQPVIRVSVAGKEVGRLGKIREEQADTYEARYEVWYADIDLDLLMDMRRDITFQPMPRFPVIRRDMTLIAPAGLAIGSIIDTVRELQESLLEDVFLVAVYTPQGRDERNLSFRFVYRHPERTLKDKEADKINARIGRHLTERLSVRFA